MTRYFFLLGRRVQRDPIITFLDSKLKMADRIDNYLSSCVDLDYTDGLNWSRWDERSESFHRERLGEPREIFLVRFVARWPSCWRRGISVSSGRIT